MRVRSLLRRAATDNYQPRTISDLIKPRTTVCFRAYVTAHVSNYVNCHFNVKSDRAAASSVQVSQLMHRHVIPLYPGPTSDVMLMSFTKRRQNPIFHIFSHKIIVLRISIG